MEFRWTEKIIPADPEGTYIGLPGEKFQAIPETKVRALQYREQGSDWKDVPYPEKLRLP